MDEVHYGATQVHPAGLAVLFVLGLAVLCVKRRYAIVPFLVLACFIPAAQRIVLFSLDFTFLRVLVLIGWVRLVARGELRGFRPSAVDLFLTASFLTGSVAYWLLREGEGSALVNRLGRSYDAIGLHLYLRCHIRNMRDLAFAVRVLAWLAILALPFFVAEKMTGRNVFSIFGGVPELTKAREGRLRAQGPYSHPILAGCFWASLVPLLLSQRFDQPKRRMLWTASFAASTGIIIMCSSSTPAAGWLAAIACFSLWPLRRLTREIVLAGIATLVALHIVMKAPVWHLIARVDLAGGSTGWHRYRLIDSAVENFSEWWFLGIETTQHWGPNMLDLANQYVAIGVEGGALALMLFLCTLVAAFVACGRTIRACRRLRYFERTAWGLGVSLAATCAMFLGISVVYSPQNLTLFVLLLASSASLAQWGTQQSARLARGHVPSSNRIRRSVRVAPATLATD